MKFTTSPRTFTRARMCLRPPFGILELSHLSRRSATGRDSSFAEKATWNKRPTQMTLGGPKKIPAFMQPPSPWMNCADILLRIRSRRSRSEERRVGKEGKSGWVAVELKKEKGMGWRVRIRDMKKGW